MDSIYANHNLPTPLECPKNSDISLTDALFVSNPYIGSLLPPKNITDLLMRKTIKQTGLDYLHEKPVIINWKVIAGPPNVKLSVLQDHDWIFDQKDLDIRGMNIKLKDLRK